MIVSVGRDIDFVVSDRRLNTVEAPVNGFSETLGTKVAHVS